MVRRVRSPDDDVCLVLKCLGLHVPESEIRGRIDAYLAGRPTAPILLDTRFLPTADMPRLYAGADAFVLASRGEGWGRPWMEAMAMGLPTIGSRWSGTTMFMDDANSWLVDGEVVRRRRERPDPHALLPRPPLVSPRPGGARGGPSRGAPGWGGGRREVGRRTSRACRALRAGADRRAHRRADGGGARALAPSPVAAGDVRLARRRGLGPFAGCCERRADQRDRGGRRRGRADDPGDRIVPDRVGGGCPALAAELRAAERRPVRALPALGVRPRAEALGRRGEAYGRRGVGAVAGGPRGVRRLGRRAGSRARRPERHRSPPLHAGGAGPCASDTEVDRPPFRRAA